MIDPKTEGVEFLPLPCAIDMRLIEVAIAQHFLEWRDLEKRHNGTYAGRPPFESDNAAPSVVPPYCHEDRDNARLVNAICAKADRVTAHWDKDRQQWKFEWVSGKTYIGYHRQFRMAVCYSVLGWIREQKGAVDVEIGTQVVPDKGRAQPEAA